MTSSSRYNACPNLIILHFCNLHTRLINSEKMNFKLYSVTDSAFIDLNLAIKIDALRFGKALCDAVQHQIGFVQEFFYE